MRSTTQRGCFWTRRITCLSIGGLLFLGGYLTALWAPLSIGALTVPAQAAESHEGHGQGHHRQRGPEGCQVATEKKQAA